MGRYPFIGPAYTLASLQADCQSLVNWYLEADETGQGRSPFYLKRRPGLTTFVDLTSVGSPIRGIWAGENRLFAVAGSYLCEIFSDGTYNNRGAVGSDGKPVSILSNGTQLLVVSGGKVYCDNGTGPALVNFSTGNGTVNTDGAVVTWESGSQFFNIESGQQININGTVYPVLEKTDDTHLTLQTDAGTQVNVSWSGYGSNGVVNVFNVAPGVSYANVATGDLFPLDLAGGPVIINGTSYTVVAVLAGGRQAVISGTLTIAGAAYSCSTPVPAGQGTYLDGYFIVCQPDSRSFYISAPFDGTTWDAADIAQKEGYPDNILAIMADHEQLWLLGSENSAEVWLDTGAANFPFQRSASQMVHWGCRAAWARSRFGNGIAWLGGDEERGGPYAFYAEGSGPARISTYAIEAEWATYSVIYDAVSYVKVEDGHELLFICFPTANKTWVYDRTMSQKIGQPCWHQRGWWNGAANDQDRPVCHASVVLAAHGSQGAPLMFQSYLGDWQNGKIYTSAPQLTSDAGTAIHRIRTSPHGAGVDNLSVFISRFELLIDLGPGAASILPVLDYSIDGGHNFINPQSRTTQPGLTNQFLNRFLWWRLGMARDRVFRLTMTDATQFTVVDCYFEAEQGTN